MIFLFQILTFKALEAKFLPNASASRLQILIGELKKEVRTPTYVSYARACF